MSENLSENDGLSRRDFIKTTAAFSLAAMSMGGIAFGADPGGSDKIRVGLIGCGGRGTGAAENCIESSKGVEIYAMGDLFEDRLKSSRDSLKGKLGAGFNVSDDRAFFGFDAYKKVLDSGVDMVILATPPGFRPIHLRAAIEAGKNVFMEKPVAVDPIGLRSVIESAKMAKQKNLAIVAGTQRRHSKAYNEIIKRIHDGAIGEIVGGQVYWMMGGLWVKERTAEMSDMEWQVRNWLYFDWLSGDHIVEQHVHNLDVMNWVMGASPEKCIGVGGRQVRVEPHYGNIYDHFNNEFEFANGARISSSCCQIPGTGIERVSERFVGTKGVADPSKWIKDYKGNIIFEAPDDKVSPYVQEHADLIKSIRDGKPLNEGEQVAMSTLNAISARTSAYTGRELKLSWMLNQSKLSLVPSTFALGPNPVNPVAMPGTTKLI